MNNDNLYCHCTVISTLNLTVKDKPIFATAQKNLFLPTYSLAIHH